MAEHRGSPPRFWKAHRLSGSGRVFLAFVSGALFALLPAYYLYLGRDVGLQAPPALQPEAASPEPRKEAGQGAPSDTSNRFASRMTYELRQTPEALPPGAVKPPAPPRSARPTQAAAVPQQSGTRVPDDTPGSRIANARPIFATPPDPRDTTREIEKEGRRPDRPDPPSRQQAKAVAEPARPRYVEGRELVIPPKSRTGSAKTAPAAAGVQPASAPHAATESTRSRAGEIEGRLAATRDWLASVPQTTHTIQILGTGNEAQLKADLNALGGILEPSRIYVFRTVAQGKPSMTVVYGAYSDRQAALQALAKLPEAVRANRPVLRTVKGIRAEMSQHKTGS